MGNSGIFARFARSVAGASGHPLAFASAAGIVGGWAALGPLFAFSDTWQLVINTGTSIATFLMVFLIQNTQNRDQQALQIKLDELLRVTEGAHSALIDLEELGDMEIERIRRQYIALAREGRERLRAGGGDTGTPPIALDKFGEPPAADR
ncbi:MAG: low affinity iron permease family protein [Alphaproteobacteria bacterium]